MKKLKEGMSSVDLSKQHKSLECLQLEKVESALAAWLAQARESIDGTHLKEETLHITACLGLANFSASNEWNNRFKTRHETVYRTLSSESCSGDPQTVEDWKNHLLLQETEGYDICNIRILSHVGMTYKTVFSTGFIALQECVY
jgi:hypothetical protein